MRTFEDTMKAVERVNALQEQIDVLANRWSESNDYKALDEACKLIDKRDYTIRGIKATLRTLMRRHNWEKDGQKFALDNLYLSQVKDFEYLWW